ncbi:hypothetical protein KGF57_001010 [Candida theae]|uniref:Uncharacterized protein n=1 Tax=Candida theae TaxID=1198502 RepID=A0AAD5BHX7_9ASCO|nr:uncharacterized protein KGF57_001010 [Candida theae]KAI5964518.1 hypothetical protein KGF57_001010 [Candida theae]
MMIDHSTNSLQQAPKKSKQATLTILKLKRVKLTYMLTLTTITLNNIRDELAEAINNSGGLPGSQDDEKGLAQRAREAEGGVEVEQDLMDEDSIPVPKSEFDVVESGIGSGDKTVTGSKDVQFVDAVELSIAVPRNASAPYDNEWIELTEGNIDEVEFKDYCILAFKTSTDDKFEIVEAAYDD